MERLLRQICGRSAIVLTMVLMLALAVAGAMRPMPMPGDVDLLAFVQAGGDLADLCADSDGDGLPDGDCPACHLAALPAVPALLPKLRDADLAFVARVVAPRESRALAVVRDPGHGLRAPPALTI